MRLVRFGNVWINPEQVTHIVEHGPEWDLEGTTIYLSGNPKGLFLRFPAETVIFKLQED